MVDKMDNKVITVRCPMCISIDSGCDIPSVVCMFENKSPNNIIISIDKYVTVTISNYDSGAYLINNKRTLSKELDVVLENTSVDNIISLQLLKIYQCDGIKIDIDYDLNYPYDLGLSSVVSLLIAYALDKYYNQETPIYDLIHRTHSVGAVADTKINGFGNYCASLGCMNLINYHYIDNGFKVPQPINKELIRTISHTDWYDANRIVDDDLLDDLQDHIILVDTNEYGNYCYYKNIYIKKYMNSVTRDTWLDTFNKIRDTYTILSYGDYAKAISLINEIYDVVITSEITTPKLEIIRSLCKYHSTAYVNMGKFGWVLCPTLYMKDVVQEQLSKYVDIIDFKIDRCGIILDNAIGSDILA